MEKINIRLKRSEVISLIHDSRADSQLQIKIVNHLIDKINELVDEIEELKIQLSRVHKDRTDPQERNPYDLSNRSKI